MIRDAAGVPKTFLGFSWSKIIDAMVGSPAQGDIAYRSGTEWTRLGAGSARQVLMSGGAGANPSWVSPSSVGGMSFVTETTVTGAVATSMVLSSLDLDADEIYYLQYNIDNSSIATAAYSLQFNGDNVSTNYDAEVTGANTTSTGSLGNDSGSIATGVATGLQICGHMWIKRNFDGKAGAVGQHNFNDSAQKIQQIWAHAWTTNANVTSITVLSNVANSMSIGSYLRLFRIKR